MTLYLRLIIRFVILVMFQVLVLNNIRLGGYINPYLYVLFVIMLPYETPGWLLLVSSFLLGYTVDTFANTPGMHTAATVFIAFCRPLIIRIVIPRQDYEAESFPSLATMGLQSFVTYSLMLVFVHHFSLFLLEVFRLSDFLSTLFRAGISTVFTLLLIILTQYIFYSKR